MSDKNVLHLVLGCKSHPYSLIEDAAKKTWMTKTPDNIKSIFMYGGSSNIFWDEKNSFYVDRPENHFYNICMYKTIKAFEIFIETDYDYIYRTNNTGYFDLFRVNDFLKDKPTENFYCGSIQYYGKSKDTPTAPENSIKYASGASYFLSKDIVKLIIENQNVLYSYNLPGWCDDVAMGKLITEHLGIDIDSRSERLIVSYENTAEPRVLIDDNLDMSHYHYRIQDSADGNPDNNIKSMFKIHELKLNNQYRNTIESEILFTNPI